MGHVEVDQQLLVGGRFLQRVEVLAVDVLQERVPQQLVVLGQANHRGDGLKPGCLGGADPALAHDDLVAVALGPDHDRLQHPDGLDALGQLVEGVLVEGLPRLPRVRVEQFQWNLEERRPSAWVRTAKARERLDGGQPVADVRQRSVLRRFVAVTSGVVLRRGRNQRFESAAKPTSASH